MMLTLECKERHFPQAQNIWEFLLMHFDFFYNFPDVRFLSFPRKSWEQLLSVSENHGINAFENQDIKEHPEKMKDVDARVVYKEDYGEDIHPILAKWFGKHRFLILLLDENENDHIPLRKDFKKVGLNSKDYLDFLILHEFIHILEHLSGKQLLTKEAEDSKIFIRYYHSSFHV